MDGFVILLLLLNFVLLVAILVVFLTRRTASPDTEQSRLLLDAVRQIQQGAQSLSRDVADRLDALNRHLGEIRTLSAQMEQFQRFLTAPRRRGAVGEVLLEEVLANVLPKDMFSLQDTQIAPNLRPDAVIFTSHGKICVDAKFPAENYLKLISAQDDAQRERAARQFRRDILGHIDRVSGYVLPAAGTVDFAIMYVPAESVFTYIVEHEQELLRQANAKKVLITSPNTFYYFLHILLVALRQQIAQRRAKEITAKIHSLVELADGLTDITEKAYKQLSHAHRNFSELREAIYDFAARIKQVSRMEVGE